jgi:hypothetical protein
MTAFRRPAVRLVLAAGAAALLVPAVPALADKPVVTTAGVAFAQDGTQTHSRTGNNVISNVINCNGGECEGTDDRDTIVALNNPDRVFGNGGDDDIELDAVFVSGSSDVGIGGPGRDCIDGGGGAI